MPEPDEGKFVGPLSKRGYLMFLAVLFGIGAIATTGLVLARRQPTLDDPPKDGNVASAGPSGEYKAFVSKYLRNWPADRKPEMVLLFSGQQHNYEAPCGCTAPQSGGLERRYNLFSQLRGFGLPAVAMDLGDIYPDNETNPNHEQALIREQAQLKYFVSMKALAIMEYDAVNIGPEEFRVTLNDINEFLLNFKTPYAVIAANIADKANTYPNQNADGSVFEDFRVAQPKGTGLKVGVTGTLGESALDEIVKNNPSIDRKTAFASNKTVLPKILGDMKAKSPDVRVLLYQGTLKEAEKLAQVIDEFDIILYQTDQSDPPSQSARAPAAAGKPQPKAQLVTVGHKGRWIGVMGVFRNPDKSLDLQWEVVQLDPDFKTPPGNRANHAVVKLLEDYTLNLKDNDYLRKYRKSQLPSVKVGNKDLTPKYLGSEACKDCHAREYDIWDSSRHAHAYETLERKADFPSNRQFDPECIVCHTVGYKYKTGFRDDEAGYTTAEKSKHLFGVGCENCHGAGSLHAADPKNAQLRAAMSPWKANPNDHLTKRVVLTDKLNDNDPQKMAVPANEKQIALQVFKTCFKCHDTDNDHNYSLDKWKKIAHGSLWDPEKK